MTQETLPFTVEHQSGIDLRIYDPALRHAFTIEAPGKGDRIDAVFYDILTSPTGQRALGINQLSKSVVEETYETSDSFKRWQHIAGVYRIVRHFGQQYKDNYTEDNILQYALVACIPDLGHGVKSHVTDMLKEGMGGAENFHDLRAGKLIDLGGIQKIFDAYKITSPFDENGNVIIDVPKWVECPSPGLNVDRLHYVNAEASLMFPNNQALREAIKLENLVITDDGEFAFRDIEHARVWAKAANLCSSEHWNDPVNRLIELLSLEGMKRTIAKRYLEDVDTFDNGFVGSPEDYTFLIDRDFDYALEHQALSSRPDLFMNAVYSLIQSIAHRERQRFAKHKRIAYQEYLADPDAREYPNALVNPHRAAFGIPPAQVEILRGKNDASFDEVDSQSAPLTISGSKTVGLLKKLKIRQFDPAVVSGDNVQRLSEVDENFKDLLRQNGSALIHVGKVALHINPESQAALIQGVEDNNQFMKDAGRLEPLSPDQIRAIIASSGRRALAAAIKQGAWREL